jgi:hypothetical protein
MATVDEITREKQRVSEALARVDAQREKLAGQLAELEATERVLARYSKGSVVRRLLQREQAGPGAVRLRDRLVASAARRT